MEIPVAWCRTCKDTGPVVIEQVDLAKIGEDGSVEIIYCPGCLNILNSSAEVKIEFYDAEELERVTGWKVASND